MADNQIRDRLIWIDMEMSGLDPEKDVILEIATVVTDNELNLIATGPNLVVRREASLFATMDDWNRSHHTKSGLWDAVLKSPIDEREAERQTLEFIKTHAKQKESPLCGNSVWQDRRFLVRYMPSIDEHLHYRLVDVSSIKELVQGWYPKSEKFKTKKGSHRALDDILESIEELKFYRDNFFIKPSSN